MLPKLWEFDFAPRKSQVMMWCHANVSRGQGVSCELAEQALQSELQPTNSSSELPLPACIESTRNTDRLWWLPKFDAGEKQCDSEPWDSTVCSVQGLGVLALLPSSLQVITFPALSSLSLSNPQSGRAWLSSPSPNLQKFQCSYRTAQLISKRTNQVHRESFSIKQAAWQCKN